MRKGTVIVILLMSFILTACGRDEVTEKTLMNDFAQRYNTVAQDMKVSTHIRSARYEVMENGLPYFGGPATSSTITVPRSASSNSRTIWCNICATAIS